MKVETYVLNHQAISLSPLGSILQRLEKAGKVHAFIYLNAAYKNGDRCEHGWVGWRQGGLFTDPFNGTFFYAEELDMQKSQARLLQQDEVMNIKYFGEALPE